MTELTIEQALQQGIEAHKAGQIQEADRLYTAILNAQPKHADANHNMGVLAVGVGKVEQALPFFKTALEANPATAQFWLSYIDALIKLDKLIAAQGMLDQAKSKGAKGDGFDKLEQRLKDAGQEPLEANQIASEPQPKQPNILDTLKLDQAIKLAKKKSKDGSLEEAKRIYQDILTKFPKNKRASDELKGLAGRPVGKASKVQDAPKGELQSLMTLYNKGQLALVVEHAQVLTKQYPAAFAVWNLMGVSAAQIGQLDQAIFAFKRVLAIQPDNASGYNNMGNALKEQGKLEEAVEAYNKALAIKPDNASAYNNMGNALTEQGKLEEAIKAYNKALAIKPDYADAIENSLSLAVQLLPIIANYGYDFDTSEAQASSEIVHRPKYQIQNAIKAYLAGDFGQAYSHNNNFKACDQNLLVRLSPKDKVFCSSYNSFIGKLLDANWDEELACENKVYHLGESHCLSYAHRNIAIGGSNFRIVPRITFGAKAFHFCRTKHDQFKEVTKAHLMSLPKNSKVFLSYGEIDCRPNEGFISAARKRGKPLEQLTDQTAKGYVQWFLKQNVGLKHHLFFLNVPAPVYDEKLTADLNSEVASTVALFNAALKKYSLQHGFDTVDAFKFTAGSKGFSNGLFNIDKRHLGAKALPEIERQLS